MKMRDIMRLVEALDVPPEPSHFLAPDIGVRFEYHDSAFTVSGWLKEAPKRDISWLDNDDAPVSDDGAEDIIYNGLTDILYASQPEIGPRKQKLVWCQRKDATHVSGKGVSGCVAPIDMIKVLGPAVINKKYYNDLLSSQMRRLGQPVR